MQRHDRPRATELLGLLTPIGLAVLAYARVLQGEFQFDDVGAILENPAIRSLSRWVDEGLSPGAILAGRPLTALTFVANYAAGGYDPLGYHAVNLALHVAMVGIVALFTLRVASLAGAERPRRIAGGRRALRGAPPPQPGGELRQSAG